MQTEGKKDRIFFISWLRAISVVLILLCHFTQTHSNAYVVMTSQIFNVGVNIFIVISGFLFGRLGVTKPYGKWIIRRAKRIYFPFWLFLIFISLVHLCQGYPIQGLPLIKSILGVHGFSYVFPGFAHTWFITAILLCYALTPVMDALVSVYMNEKRNLLHLILALMVAPFGIAFLPGYAILGIVPFYGLAFLLGKCWDCISIDRNTATIALVGVMGALVFRFTIRALADGTIWYNNIVVPYTHYIVAFCCFTVASHFLNVRPWRIIKWIENNSFEIYLYHYMFICPPLSVMGVSKYWTANCLIVICCTFVLSSVMHFGLDRVERKL